MNRRYEAIKILEPFIVGLMDSKSIEGIGIFLGHKFDISLRIEKDEFK